MLHKQPAAASAVVEDITISVPGQADVQAWLSSRVATAKKHSQAGVLWLHWLGEINGDRSEYLSEAVTLAGKGVVSVLPQGYFPWVPNPDGTTGDVTLRGEPGRRDARAPWTGCASERSVDQSRIALVGHDYGAMYGALLADSDSRISTMVLQAPDALMGNWFAKFWLRSPGPRARRVPRPVRRPRPRRPHRTARGPRLHPVGRRRLLHRSGRAGRVRRRPAPTPITKVYEGYDHEFQDGARVDRLAFLEAQLGL